MQVGKYLQERNLYFGVIPTYYSQLSVKALSRLSVLHVKGHLVEENKDAASASDQRKNLRC